MQSSRGKVRYHHDVTPVHLRLHKPIYDLDAFIKTNILLCCSSTDAAIVHWATLDQAANPR